MSIADLWYEASPYIYAPLGMFVLLAGDGTLARVSGGLLLVAAGTILRLRWTHRRRRAAAANARAARRARDARRSGSRAVQDARRASY